jgi:energy-coupling factor transporter ATP-binding protein EcfA2
MRLRYLHLAHYPPLADLAVAFSPRAPWAAFEPAGEVARCAIHFVIGLNGSGKSHLLRATAATFLALADERLPAFPVSLVYELGRAGAPGHRTLIFDCPGHANGTSMWQAESWTFPEISEPDTFQSAIDYLREVAGPRAEFGGAVFKARIPRGDYPQAVQDALPRAVLAYSSGALLPWRDAWQAPVDGDSLDLVTQGENYDPQQERPVGWSAEDEARVVIDGGTFDTQPPPTSTIQELIGDNFFRRPLLLEPITLTAALLAVTLYDTQQKRDGQPNTQLGELFAKANWRRLVGVRLRVNLDRAMHAPRALLARLHDALFTASEVIAEPHPTEAWRSLYFDIEGRLQLPEGDVFQAAERLNGLEIQGQALLALLGEPGDTAFERFGALLTWRQYGVLDDIELFIRRVDKPEVESMTSLTDSGVLRYSELSDGERMVLGRWALFHLLARQDDALLLLDEPETHFNDSWKREIVQVVDQAMGDDSSQVLIATHSAIVLSDVFDDEVVLIRKNVDGQSSAAPVGDLTFATDPSALMMSVFDTDDSIGRRAQQRIEAFMQAAASKVEPTVDDVRQLQALIRRLGTGFYRTELQTLLNRWQQAPDLRAIENVIPSLQSDTLKDELRALILNAKKTTDSQQESSDA